MQQHQFATAVKNRARSRRLDFERNPGRMVVVGATDHDQAVGLAQAELRPRRERCVGTVEDEGRFHLAAGEPFGLLILRVRAQHLDLGPEAAEGSSEQDREPRRRYVRT